MVRQVASLIVPAAIACALAWLLTPLSIRIARWLGAIDEPGERRVHDHAIPRLGGLAVVASAGIVLGAGALGIPWAPRWAASRPSLGIILGLVPILIVSLRDDVSPLKALPKFLVHAAGAAVAMSFGVLLSPSIHFLGLELHLGWLLIPLSALWLIGLTNAFNFVDGLDGLSSGLGLIAAASLAGVLVIGGRSDLAAAALVLGGSLLGFLPFNLHPAKVFLGDTGSTAVGYLLGCFTLTSSNALSAGLATLIPVLLVGIPVADTLVSILRRTVFRIAGSDPNRVYEADHNHIHHRLLAIGLSHRAAVLTLYAVGASLAAAGLLSLLMTNQQSGLLLLGILLAGFLGLTRLNYGEFALLRRGVALRMYDLPVMQRSFFAVFVDVVLIAAALYVAIVLKLGTFSLTGKRALYISTLAVLVPTHFAAFGLFRVYRGSWRLAGVHDFQTLALAIASASFSSLLLASLLGSRLAPASVFAIYGFVELVLAVGSRVSYRLLDDVRVRGETSGRKTLIYGAGVAGGVAAREILSNSELGLSLVGFIDDNATRVGKTVIGYPILGGVDDLEAALARSRARVIVVSSKHIPEQRLARVREVCARQDVRLLQMRLELEAARDADTAASRNPTPLRS